MDEQEDELERGDEVPRWPEPFSLAWNARMKRAQWELTELVREGEQLNWQRQKLPRLT